MKQPHQFDPASLALEFHRRFGGQVSSYQEFQDLGRRLPRALQPAWHALGGWAWEAYVGLRVRRSIDQAVRNYWAALSDEQVE